MRSPRRLVPLLAGVALLAACGVSSQPAPEPVPPERLPAASPSASAGAAQARVWVARGDRVVPVFLDVTRSGLRARLEALLALDEDQQQLPTAIPPGTRLLLVARSGPVVRLELSGQLLEAERRDVPVALAQLVLTATEDARVDEVEVRAGGQPVTLTDDRDRPVRRPLRRDDVAVFVQGPLD